MPLPKVLIIGQPFNNDTGGGITLSNLFSGWDKNRIAVACSPYLLQDNIDSDICDTYYQLGQKEGKWVFPFNLFNRKYYSGIIKFSKEKKSTSVLKKSPLRVKMIMKFFYPMLKSMGLINYIFTTRLSEEFCRWLNEFKPDIIYAQASSRDGVMFCSLVHSYLNKPLIFHMMDDWPSTITARGIFGKKLKRTIDYEFRKLLDKADILMSISDQMAKEYKKRYNKDFITFHNPIDIQFWKKHQRNSYRLSNSPTILYAGRTGLGIQHSLELIAQAVQRVNEELGLTIKFVLQTSQKPSWVASYPCVVHKPFVSYDELPRVFSEADLLVLPYDFSQQSLRYIKHSMPTKAPEFMVSGTPIIIFAPEETAIVTYAEKYNWAKVVSKNNVNDLAEGIKFLIQDEKNRQMIARAAVAIAENNHNSFEVKRKFKETICLLSNSHKLTPNSL
jgi:glycosyltransferase involved in cell wall biosynthesis